MNDNPEPELIPEPFSTLIDQVCAADAAYFAAHPGAGAYIRESVPGEFYPNEVPAWAWVLVTEFYPGARSRQPIEPIPAGEVVQ